jgi:uncharacterized protein YbbC (DUF1343 family)
MIPASRALAVMLLGASLLTCVTARRAPPRAAAPAPASASAALVAPPPPGPAPVAPPPPEDPQFAEVDAAIKDALAEGKMPGCVVVVGSHDEILLRKAYGSRSILPERTPMTLDTVFDLASLTKPLATSTSVMLLVERGKVDLDAPASKYVPELAKLAPFTVRQLLVHTSGLPPVTAVSDYATTDRAALMTRIGELHPKHQPGEAFVYSDVGFMVLEEIVRRVSGKGLDAFTADAIWKPLGMNQTGFLPPPELRARAAPTEQRDGGFIQGDVHDPRAFALGGVAGHAGLFSTGDDLARFAQMMLEKGSPLVSAATWTTWTARNETSKGGRALGWDIDSSFASHRSSLMSPRAFGHGGFTGTAMWIDPVRDLFLVFLSNRVHPDGKGAVNPLIAEVGTRALRALEVRPGIDVLRDEGFARLRGSHVGLVTNANARAMDGTSTIDALRAAPGVTLGAIFTPEHGLGAEREGKVGDSSYEGVPVYSLYGARSAPNDETLAGLDALVFDLQDVGVRFYTYASTMNRAMKVAADHKLRFFVLDRPNPIDGVDVEGPVLANVKTGSFVNHHALPVRHGMTMGELARLFADDDRLDLRLDVVRMKGWHRKDYMDRTGLPWVSPSPNLRSVAEVVLYPAIGLLEATNLSVGRGTDTPFEIFGAPWFDPTAVGAALARTPGVSFEPTTFTPASTVFAGQACKGLRVRVTDRARFEPIRTALAIALAIHARHPEWEIDKLDRLLQSDVAMAELRAGHPVAQIEATWSRELAAFRDKREKFLLYR